MDRKMLKIVLIAVGAAAVLLFSGSGYASSDAGEAAGGNPLLSVLREIAPELPQQESADWREAVEKSPAYFFLLTAD